MKKTILFVILSFLLVSCEYSIDYYFEVDNQSSEDLRVVIASNGDPESLNFAKEVDMIIPSLKKERVFSYWGGVGGRKVKADDPYSSEALLPPAEFVQIYIGEKLIDDALIKEIRKRKYWEYHPNGQSTTYILVLTQDLLNNWESSSD